MRKKTTAGKERTRRQLEQTIAAYQKLAEEDWLTGLYNGRAMEEEGGRIPETEQSGVNDSHGYRPV